MGDGPPGNLPAGLDAYAGYVNYSGIGITYPQVLADWPTSKHLSITTDGSRAECADVENGAMSSWVGYTVGYCDLANAQANINQFGRPRRLWIAHHNDIPHLCDSKCGYGFTDHADGTQWTDHGGAWDESLLADDFFDFQTLLPRPIKEDTVVHFNDSQGNNYIAAEAADQAGHLLVFRVDPGAEDVRDLTDAATAAAHAHNPADTRIYTIAG